MLQRERLPNGSLQEQRIENAASSNVRPRKVIATDPPTFAVFYTLPASPGATSTWTETYASIPVTAPATTSYTATPAVAMATIAAGSKGPGSFLHIRLMIDKPPGVLLTGVAHTARLP